MVCEQSVHVLPEGSAGEVAGPVVVVSVCVRHSISPVRYQSYPPNSSYGQLKLRMKESGQKKVMV